MNWQNSDPLWVGESQMKGIVGNDRVWWGKGLKPHSVCMSIGQGTCLWIIYRNDWFWNAFYYSRMDPSEDLTAKTELWENIFWGDKFGWEKWYCTRIHIK